MRRSGFKRKVYDPKNPTKGLKRDSKPLKRSKLRLVGKSSSTDLKKEIQALLREIGIIRDGGCVLRHYPVSGKCGGYRNDGNLILQAEHLNSRSNTATFGDMRNIVILCQRHHIYFKPQSSSIYWELIERHIGKERWEWFKRARDDKRHYKVDLLLIKLALEQDLKKLKNANI